ncbi:MULTISPECIES: TIGR04211 family SH3 domain-containing protein [Dickeya]|uniref:TIGR04211 family SH3 domain-containing protein n=1 Tax=Dickeya fangzhongdai TaxID=1778540 RepID=A0A2K8QUE7_9GAMM|nr:MULTISPECIES: TIGR04211 family SH3 domain-containing protein [Dickeya]ATZ96735.1 TIGR04211 family SH3 domain-containing protein [Dickeya fangzhongdai]QOH50172.1 SH3 domain-containing protein [Dickeya fangzhongdai]QOH54479.1 SH3 domain-containing protein [Dickeya fangzhongdai]UGA53266.1 SH3 domain-containing protein [Dickeya fangzhongdai]ULR33431.1 SH3 domain-containing protein [Dickeya fangzhongdai]
MNKLPLFLAAILGLSTTLGLHAEEKRYISDELVTYTRSGPGNQYRIVGTLNAGEAVTLISANDGAGYAQIRDEKGRTSWIQLDQLSQTPSLKTRVPELENQVKTLTDRLNSVDQDWNQRTVDLRQKVAASDGTLSSLQKENQALKTQLEVAQKKLEVANLQLDDKQRTLIMQWFMYGGGVAGGGLVLGLLLPHLLPRRKKNDRWMG